MRSKMNSTCERSQVHQVAGGYLQQLVGIKDHGPKCTASVLTTVLLFAASCRDFLHGACRRLRWAPTSQAVFAALRAMLPPMRPLEQAFNRAFAEQVPKGVRKRPQIVALDLTQNPYYGQPHQAQNELCGGKAKQGTRRFHTYATACVVRHGERFTLAVTYVRGKEPLADVVARLVRQVREIGVRIRFVLLDRGFYNLNVISQLQAMRCPFLVPVVRRGRRPKDPAQAKGPWHFFTWKKSGWATHTLQHKGRSATVRICVSCINRGGRHGKHGRRPLVFAYWGFRPGSTRWVRETYRGRFGIETSYRQMNEVRARTCSRDPLIRLLMVGIALLLRNVWVWFHLVVFAQRLRGGGLRLHLERLRFRTLILCLQYYAQQLLGLNEDIAIQPLLL